MTLGTAISRVTGFIRTAALASVLGLTARTMADSYNLANITPNIVYDLILGGVLSSLFIPLISLWRPYQLAYRVFFHVLAHIQTNNHILIAV